MHRNLRSNWLVAICLCLLLISCGKRKWKLPVDVSFMVDVNRTPSKSGELNFTGGTLVLSSFQFDGKRVQGDDVFFDREFDNGLTLSFDGNAPITELDFEIPQGTYTRLEIEIEIEGNGDKSIVVDGTYKNSGGTTYPLRLELEEIEIYREVAKDGSGSTEIVLNKDIPSDALIELDPVHWFGTISDSQLDNADLVNVGGDMTILINDANNEDIFDEIADRVDESSEVVFDQ